MQLEGNNVEGENTNIDADVNVVDVFLDDEEEVLRLIERDAISQILNSVEPNTVVFLTSHNLAQK